MPSFFRVLPTLFVVLMVLSLPTDLATLNYARELLTQQAMALLGTWALLNLLVSGYYVARTDPRTVRHYFHQMNAGWNIVNALLAAWGLLHTSPSTAAGFTLAQSQEAQHSFERLLLLNAGLDLVYIGIGSWLRARAHRSRRPERLQGFGLSLWLQGGFLFLFDVSFYLLYHRYAAQLAGLVL